MLSHIINASSLSSPLERVADCGQPRDDPEYQHPAAMDDPASFDHPTLDRAATTGNVGSDRQRVLDSREGDTRKRCPGIVGKTQPCGSLLRGVSTLCNYCQSQKSLGTR